MGLLDEGKSERMIFRSELAYLTYLVGRGIFWRGGAFSFREDAGHGSFEGHVAKGDDVHAVVARAASMMVGVGR